MENQPIGNWETYTVWYLDNGVKLLRTITALSAKDCKKAFINTHQTPTKRYLYCRVNRPTTQKQKLSHQYRQCIGALRMAEMNVGKVSVTPIIYNLEEVKRRSMLQTAAINNVKKAMRDTKDLFTRLGLKIK